MKPEDMEDPFHFEGELSATPSLPWRTPTTYRPQHSPGTGAAIPSPLSSAAARNGRAAFEKRKGYPHNHTPGFTQQEETRGGDPGSYRLWSFRTEWSDL